MLELIADFSFCTRCDVPVKSTTGAHSAWIPPAVGEPEDLQDTEAGSSKPSNVCCAKLSPIQPLLRFRYCPCKSAPCSCWAFITGSRV